MSELVNKGYISKKDKGAGEYEDLFLEGVELLQQLSSAHWTDYNEHDPGVTIFENIAYTMTNLSFKTDLPIKDILFESKGKKLESGDNGFFVPSEILTTNPITLNDFRKIFIDQITNVKNAWVVPQNDSIQAGLKGLYHIYIETYNYPSDPSALKKETERIVGTVRMLFHEHRNLCEDLYEVTILKPFQLKLNLRMSLEDMAKGEEVFANIYYQINNYLAHEVRFSSLWELREEGQSINSIFNGPYLENGFIPDAELTERKKTIIPSEIIKIITKVEEVISVDFFELSYQDQGSKKDNFKSIKEDFIHVPENCSPILLFPTSNTELIIESAGVSFPPDLVEVQKQLAYIQAMNYGNFKSVSQSLNTINIPEGNALDINSYYPIREQFPLTYGIGEYGLPKGLDESRYAQANQLKAYLLPFDQLMNNFLAQLKNLYTLYDSKEKNLSSYFYQELEDMPKLIALIQESEYESQEDTLLNWKASLKELNMRFDKAAIMRLNQVADNLLSRFSEEFSTYSLKKIHKSSYGKKLTSHQFEDDLLAWKRMLISNYGQLSYDRSKAYNYRKEKGVVKYYKKDQTINEDIPGIIKKTAILMGIENFETRSLSDAIVHSGIKVYQKKEEVTDVFIEGLEINYSQDEIDEDEIEAVTIDEPEEDFKHSFYYLGASATILEEVLKYGVIAENYEIKKGDNRKGHCHVLYGKPEEEKKTIHISSSEALAKKAINYTVDFLIDLNKKSEGLYLIEHLLLAPPYQGEFFGFSFLVQLADKKTIQFNQVSLCSFSDRNNDVDKIMNTLIQKETLQFKVLQNGNQFNIEILLNGTSVVISDASYNNNLNAKAIIDQIEKQVEGCKLDQFVDSINYYAFYHENKVDETFFSFQMSLILPAWPVRFQNKNFRTKFDNTMYEQAPVHIVFETYWLELKEMIDFEKTYYQWIEAMSNEDQVEEKMKISYELITRIPHYFLHDND